MNRKPTSILEARGKLAARERNSRTHEPQPKAGIGPAPKHLSKAEQACWDELVSIAPGGVLYDSDRVHLEITAKLLAYVRAQGIAGTAPQLLNRLAVCLTKLGLTPADRSAIVVPDAYSQNPFAQLDR